MNTESTKRICLWSGPRNISTAMMYSFAQRSDTKVVDEPLYAHYLRETDASSYHPGAQDVLQQMENNGEKVIESILGFHEKPVLFYKQMTHHLVNLDWDFLKKTINIILTRNPGEMLTSYAKEVEYPTMRDVGYAKQLELFTYLQEIGRKPIVLVSEDVLMNPSKMIQKLCGAIGIPFQDSMLRWEKGPRAEDGIWATYWYQSVHNSTGFKPYQPKKEPMPKHLKPLFEECKPIYQTLKEHALDPD